MDKIVYDVRTSKGGRTLETFNKKETAENVLKFYGKYYHNACIIERSK